MSKLKVGGNKSTFEIFASKVTDISGSPTAFIGAFVIVIVWGITGPLFGYSDAWQLVINSVTNILTFLMVFAIQKAQNKDGKAIQIKLNELLSTEKRASNSLISIEDLSENELDIIHKYFTKLAELARHELPVIHTHSQKEALSDHSHKLRSNEVIHGSRGNENPRNNQDRNRRVNVSKEGKSDTDTAAVVNQRSPRSTDARANNPRSKPNHLKEVLKPTNEEAKVLDKLPDNEIDILKTEAIVNSERSSSNSNRSRRNFRPRRQNEDGNGKGEDSGNDTKSESGDASPSGNY